MFLDLVADEQWFGELARCCPESMCRDVVKVCADRLYLERASQALERSRDRLIVLVGSKPADDAETLASDLAEASDASAVAVSRAMRAMWRIGGGA